MIVLLRKLLTPFFFRYSILIEIFHVVHYYAGYIFYKYSVLFNKVYIGGYLSARQEIGRGRHKVLLNILNLLIKKKRKVGRSLRSWRLVLSVVKVQL